MAIDHRDVVDQHALFAAAARDRALILVNQAGLTTSWNRGAELLTGWTQREVLETPIDRLYPIAVSVSLLSACLTPFILKRSDYVIGLAEKCLPSHWQRAIERYHSAMLSHQGARIVPALLRAYMPLVVVNFVLVLSTTWVARFLIYPYMRDIFGAGRDVRILGLTVDLLLCLPFFWGLCLRRPPKEWRKKAKAYPRLRWVELVLQFARICLGFVLFLFVTAHYMSWQALSGVTILVLAAVVLGGAGNLPGVILGAVLISYIPERIRSFQETRFFFFGVALVVVMIFRPAGLLPSRRRAMEVADAGLIHDDRLTLAGADLEASIIAPADREERADG